MKTKRKTIIGIVGIAILVTLLAIYYVNHVPEPSYQGRTLSKWLDIYYGGYSGNYVNPPEAEVNEAKHAIKEIGTNAIPFILNGLQSDGFNRRGTALTLFRFIGESGRPAIPALVELLRDKNEKTRAHAFYCLQEIRPDKEVYVSVLIQMVHDGNKNLSFYAAQDLIGIDPDAAKKAGVFETYPDLSVLLDDVTNNIEINQTNAPK